MKYRTITVDGRKYRITFSDEGLIAVVREVDTGTRIGYLVSAHGGWKVRDTLVWFKTATQAAKSLVLHHIFNEEGINWSAIS